ncbi:MAG: cysteine desulfurase [Candidatus Methanomethylophilaceae archaeon]|nr:cysteine desulfurase [Candidatus Methanomethylophilaceae archaeon]MDI3542175.1 cysteine desulfurase [Candidatus Methanomethylophilaceae archaeon]
MQVYADHAATTPMSSSAFKTMCSYLRDNYGNPSGVHSLSQNARMAMEDARTGIASAIGATKNELFFTSNGSEADNWAIKSAAELMKEKGKHVITSSIEHHAVLSTCKYLEERGYEVTYLPVDANGQVSVDSLKEAMRKDTILVSVMMANNEVGTIQPIKELASVAKEGGALFHTDAVQAIGHLSVDVNELGVDMLSMSGHKFGGPKGIGALYIRRELKLPPLIHGGGQERGRRAGTENVAAILAMAAALEDSLDRLDEKVERLRKMRDRLIAGVIKIDGSVLTGHPCERLPGLASFVFEGIEGESAVLMLDYRGIQTSTGSACSTGSLEASHVLRAMGIPNGLAHGSIRFSLGAENTEEQIDHILVQTPLVVERLRSLPPLCTCGRK